MRYTKPPASADLGAPMTAGEFGTIIDEAIDQPPWRAQADIEADYVDGNQLDSKLLARLKSMGVPPAKENVIGPAIASVCGYEAKTRTDWRVSPDGDPEGQDVADALNFRLNQAERHSKADAAMSEAFRPQASVGLGWVEVARSSDPFAYNKRCRYVHRNEIFWDMRARERDLSDAGWLLRERFIKKSRAAAAFPKHKALIEQAEAASGLGGYGSYVVEVAYRPACTLPQTPAGHGRAASSRGIARRATKCAWWSFGIGAGSVPWCSSSRAVAWWSSTRTTPRTRRP